MSTHDGPFPSVHFSMAIAKGQAAPPAMLVSGEFGKTRDRIRGGVKDGIIDAVGMLVGENPTLRGAGKMKIS